MFRAIKEGREPVVAELVDDSGLLPRYPSRSGLAKSVGDGDSATGTAVPSAIAIETRFGAAAKTSRWFCGRSPKATASRPRLPRASRV